jgi:hypothetical protein
MISTFSRLSNGTFGPACGLIAKAEVMPMRVHQLATATLVLVFAAGMILTANLFVAYRSPAKSAGLIPYPGIGGLIVSR